MQRCGGVGDLDRHDALRRWHAVGLVGVPLAGVKDPAVTGRQHLGRKAEEVTGPGTDLERETLIVSTCDKLSNQVLGNRLDLGRDRRKVQYTLAVAGGFVFYPLLYIRMASRKPASA